MTLDIPQPAEENAARDGGGAMGIRRFILSRSSRKGLPVFFGLALVASMLGIMRPASAAVLPCSQFPGFSTWTQNGSPRSSAAWLDNVQVWDVHGPTPLRKKRVGTVSANKTITGSPGDILRAELFVCNSVSGATENYAGVFQFRDTGQQPNWNSRDKVPFDAGSTNTNVKVGRFFQQIPLAPLGTTKQFTVTPILNHSEDTVAQGPMLNVNYSSVGTIPSNDARGPNNGGTCGSLAPNTYQAQIAGGGNPAHGVWDNLKGGINSSLKVTSPDHITVSLANPNNHTPLAFDVGDPVTIEGASPPDYDGGWTVTSAPDALDYVATRPNVGSLPDGGGGTSTRYYGSGEPMPRGISLAGLVEVCSGSAGAYFATEKLEPSVSGMRTVRWESESKVPGGLTANVAVDVKWYQTMPCAESGDLNMWPRLVQTLGDVPDQNILAEGLAFAFHVVDTVPTRC